MLKIEVLADIKDAVTSMNNLQKESAKSLDKIAKEGQSAFNKIGKSIVVINQGIELMGRAWGAVSGTIGSAITAANQQENAINALNSALVSSGEFTSEVSKDFQNFASELQRVTSVGDEVTLANIAVASSMGVNKDQMKDVIKAATDLAARFNLDLTSATRLVAKSMVDNGEGMKRFGVEVEKANTKSGTLANTVKAIGDAMGGAAADKAKTFTGRMEGLTGAIGDASEEFGFLITKSSFVREALASAQKAAELMGQAFKNIPKFIEENRTALEYVAVAIGSVTVGLGAYAISMGIASAATTVFAGVLAVLTSPITLIVAALAGLGTAAYALYQNWDEVTHFMQKSLLETQIGFYNFAESALSSLAPFESGFRTVMAGIIELFAFTTGALIQGAIDIGSKFAEIFGVTLPESFVNFQDNLLATSEQIANGTGTINEYTEAARLQAEKLQENVEVLQEVREQELAIEEETAALKAEADTGLKDITLQNQAEINKKKKEGQKEITEDMKRQEAARIKILEDEAKRQLLIKAKQDEQFYFTENAKRLWEEGTWQDRINQTQAGFKQLGSLQKSSNKEMAAVGTVANVALAIQDTYKAATGAYASLAGIPIVGPGLGIAAAAAAISAGLANVNQIRSNAPKFATGGIVGGSSFTGDQVTARVNSGEMILNKNQQTRLFNQISTGNGGGLESAIYALGDRIANIEVVLKADDIEIARSVNRAVSDGYIIARTA